MTDERMEGRGPPRCSDLARVADGGIAAAGFRVSAMLPQRDLRRAKSERWASANEPTPTDLERRTLPKERESIGWAVNRASPCLRRSLPLSSFCTNRLCGPPCGRPLLAAAQRAALPGRCL